MTFKTLTAVSLIALVSACGQHPGPKAMSATDQGYNAFRNGEYAVAEQAYRGALASDPANVKAMLGLAEVYEQTGRSGEAASLYRQVQATQSGAIRVWGTRRPMQDGVTETAMRRLGAIGHGPSTVSYQAPQTVAPVTYSDTLATARLPTMPAPAEPTYALDNQGIVYFADPGATQPLVEEVYETPDAAMIEYAAPAPMMYEAAPAPVSYQPAPVTQYEAAPITFEPAPMQYQQAPAPVQYQPTPVSYQPAPAPVQYQAAPPAYQGAPQPYQYQYQSAPAYAPMPQQYQPAPAYAPTPVRYQPAQVAPSASLGLYSPSPTPRPASAYTAPQQAPLTTTLPRAGNPQLGAMRSQPGYVVINGDLVYVSGDDISAGGGAAVQQAPVQTPVPQSLAPVLDPADFGLPQGTDTMNGIPSIQMN